MSQKKPTGHITTFPMLRQLTDLLSGRMTVEQYRKLPNVPVCVTEPLPVQYTPPAVVHRLKRQLKAAKLEIKDLETKLGEDFDEAVSSGRNDLQEIRALELQVEQLNQSKDSLEKTTQLLLPAAIAWHNATHGNYGVDNGCCPLGKYLAEAGVKLKYCEE